MSSDDLVVNSKKYWFPVYSKGSMVGFLVPSRFDCGFSLDFDNVRLFTDSKLESVKPYFGEEKWNTLMKFKQIFVDNKHKTKDNNVNEQSK